MIALAVMNGTAWATLTIDDCTSADGPNEYWSNYCDGACTYDSATDVLTCDMSTVDTGPATAFAVASYGSSTYEYSVFGMVDSTRFCCAINEDSTDLVLQLVLEGTSSCDELHLSWDDGSGGNPEENLEPASGQLLEGYVYGYGGYHNVLPGGCDGDYIYGSDYVGSDYRDKLFGGNDPDHIYGLGDRDFIDAGPGDDYVEGDMGSDVIVGGCGADTLKGEAGNDTLCDSNGASLLSGVCDCNSDGDDLLDGGDGKDTLWYEDSSTCSGGTLSAATTCGNHLEDSFGDVTYWSMPADGTCEVYSSIPADCSFP